MVVEIIFIECEYLYLSIQFTKAEVSNIYNDKILLHA